MSEKRKFNDEEILAIKSKLNEEEGILAIDGVRAVLECPFCMTIPGGKIYQCENAHKICERCYDHLPNELCPKGKCHYNSPEPSRYREIETLIEMSNISVECPYDDCNMTLKAKDMRTHTKVCTKHPRKRPLVPCVISEDCEPMALNKMEYHLREDHSMLVHEGNRLEQNQPLRLDDLVDGEYVASVSDGKYKFYYVLMIMTPDDDSIVLFDDEEGEGLILAFVKVHGDEDVAKQYVATISMGKDGSSSRVESTLPVSSVLAEKDTSLDNSFTSPVPGFAGFSSSFMIVGSGKIKDLISECDADMKKLGFTYVLHHVVEIKKIE